MNLVLLFFHLAALKSLAVAGAGGMIDTSRRSRVAAEPREWVQRYGCGR